MMRKVFFALLLSAAAARAQYPVQDMDRYSLGIGYTLAFRGADITKAAVPSHEMLHVVSVAYAPVPYLSLQAGAGFDRFSVDPYNQAEFQGSYGFSPAFGIAAYTPFLADILRASAGTQMVYLNSSDDRGFRYSGFIGNPFLGLIVSPSTYLDLAFGGRAHIIDGTMSAPRGAADQSFSNKETWRGYLSVTLKTPSEGAFLTFDADMSPSFSSDWSSGPREATLGVSFGAILGWKKHGNPNGEKSNYFPAYSEMKEKEKKMEEEIR